MQNHNNHIALLPAILKKHGVEDIVISPGSRNAPLTQVFYEVFGKNCISIVDERSAGYFALGVSLKKQKPAILISTSGTATLNYAPAVAESFHQGVPLIVITADRPPEWLGMQDNQTIHQKYIYGLNCKGEFELPITVSSDDEEWHISRLINEAHNLALHSKPGPVHINVPMREPLYTKLAIPDEVKVIRQDVSFGLISDEVVLQWNNAKKILLLVGQLPPSAELNELVNKLLVDKRITVIAENISNLQGSEIISQLDMLRGIKSNEERDFLPDLVVVMGGQIVSKPLKGFLRKNKIAEHWYVSPDGAYIDTYQNLGRVIQSTPERFVFTLLARNKFDSKSEYRSHWLSKQRAMMEEADQHLMDIPYSDLKVFQLLSDQIEKDCIIFAGNSSVIRYLQFFKLDVSAIYANRGTSGIDGCLSTATGIAYSTSKTVYCILGDLSFVYDSNAFWNKNLPQNLKVIVINNQGGNIFGLIDGPSKQEGYEEFFLAEHPARIDKICEAFNVKYFSTQSVEEINRDFKQFAHFSGCALIEIMTPGEVNPGIFSNFVNHLSK